MKVGEIYTPIKGKIQYAYYELENLKKIKITNIEYVYGYTLEVTVKIIEGTTINVNTRYNKFEGQTIKLFISFRSSFKKFFENINKTNKKLLII